MQPALAAQPLLAPLLPLLLGLSDSGAPPECAALNSVAEERGIVSGSGTPLRFVVPGASGMSYEERAYWLGEIETRPGNWHDCFNALTWIRYPLTKAALNARHHQALHQPGVSTGGRRGPLRDALTQFDECGVAVASSSLELWAGICAHRWKDVFWTRREATRRDMRVLVFGHATFDMLRTPHIGLCGKAVFFHVDDDWLAQPLSTQCADIDLRMAQRFKGEVQAYAKAQDFHPLPLLGIPGATPENEFPAYYDDTRQFRPLRCAPV